MVRRWYRYRLVFFAFTVFRTGNQPLPHILYLSPPLSLSSTYTFPTLVCNTRHFFHSSVAPGRDPSHRSLLFPTPYLFVPQPLTIGVLHHPLFRLIFFYYYNNISYPYVQRAQTAFRYNLIFLGNTFTVTRKQLYVYGLWVLWNYGTMFFYSLFSIIIII